MAVKNEVKSTQDKQAELVVNNAFIDGISRQLEEKKKYGLSFPSDYNPTNALTGAYLMLKETTDKSGKNIIESCSKPSLVNSLMDMVTMGLNVQKKQGYFIAYGGKCQFQKSYFGNTTIARRYGMKSINATVIYENDDFKYHIENAVIKIDHHNQNFNNIDVSKIVGAYAVATMKDGTVFTEIMNRKQIEQAWNQKIGGYKPSSSDTHVKFAEEMSKKTVKNRLLKNIINTYGDEYVADTYNEVEEKESVDTVAEDVKYEVERNENAVDFPGETVESNQEVDQVTVEVVENTKSGQDEPF